MRSHHAIAASKTESRISRRKRDRGRTVISKRPNSRAAFLNIPYDERFGDLYLAYISALVAHGITPRATLEIPGSARRLDRIVELIGTCRYSFHDLSRVEVDPVEPVTPRMNMPFELGLTVAWDLLMPNRHVWFVLESINRRALKSLSDLAGTDVYIHNGTPEGVFREVGNALVRKKNPPTVQDVGDIYRALQSALPGIMEKTGARSIFEARAFQKILFVASDAARKKTA